MRLLDRLLGRPTFENLIDEVVTWLHDRGCTEVEVDRERMEVRLKDRGSPCTLYLGNLFRAYREAARKERRTVLHQFLASMLLEEEAKPADYASARLRLLPIVRSVGGMGVVGQTHSKPGDAVYAAPAQRPLAADVVVGLVVDHPHSMAYVLEETLKDWGVSWVQALQDAVDNLRALPEHGGWREIVPGVWSGEWGDSYESSRLLIPDLIHRLGINQPVAMAPFRNSLLVTSASNPGAIQRLLDTVHAALQHQDRWVSFELLRLEGQAWVPFELTGDAAARQAVMLLQNRADSYEGQRHVLEGQFESQDVDVFVATCSLMQQEGRPMTSYAVWTEGVDTLLPQAETIVMLHGEGDGRWHVRLPWHTVRETFGHLMEPTDHVPTRYRVRQFPDRATLHELAASAGLDG